MANVARLPAGASGAAAGAPRTRTASRRFARGSCPRLAGACSAASCGVRVERPVARRAEPPRPRARGRSARDASMRRAGRTVSVRAPGRSGRSCSRSASRPTRRRSRRSRAIRSSIGRSSHFLGGERSRDSTSAAARRLEREVRSVELLSSEEKLMAGLPNFATYFGRDMMMTALMMRPIWRPAMSEHVIASVLRKLSPARRREPRGGARRPGDPRERRPSTMR